MLGAIIPVIGGILDKLIPDKGEKARMENEIVRALIALDTGQLEINKAEATHGSVFVAGWRPFIGWVCGLGIFWAFIGYPVAEWVTVTWYPAVTMPNIDTDNLITLVMAMLGLGAMRSYEKSKGVSRLTLGKIGDK